MRPPPSYREAMTTAAGVDVSALIYLDPFRPGLIQAKLRAGENGLTLPWLGVDELRALVMCLRHVESLHRIETRLPGLDDYQDGHDAPMGHPAAPASLGGSSFHW